MVVGIVDHQTRHPRPPRASRRSAAAWRAVRGRHGRLRRRRWPASRCCSASSPRRPPSTRFDHAAVAGAGGRARRVVAGSVLTVAYSRPLRCRGTFGRRRGADGAATPASPVDLGRPARAFVGAGRGARRRHAWCSASAPCARRRPHRRRRRVARPATATACTSRSGTASTSRSCCRPSPSPPAPRCSSAADRVERRARPRRAASRSATDGLRRHRCAASTRVADRVTGVVQTGSLPIYAGVILLTAAVVPGRRCSLTAPSWPGWPDLVDGAGAASPIVVAAARRRARRRARPPPLRRRRCSSARSATRWPALFVVQGAPDLALTQVAIETLSTVLFVLVLRRLPDRFERTLERRAGGSCASSIVGRRRRRSCSRSPSSAGARPHRADRCPTRWSSRPLPDGHGRNVVNVILVDFRGFDTLGEITVLAAAAIGAVALARAGRRRAGVAAATSPRPTPAATRAAPMTRLPLPRRVACASSSPP